MSAVVWGLTLSSLRMMTWFDISKYYNWVNFIEGFLKLLKYSEAFLIDLLDVIILIHESSMMMTNNHSRFSEARQYVDVLCFLEPVSANTQYIRLALVRSHSDNSGKQLKLKYFCLLDCRATIILQVFLRNFMISLSSPSG